MNEDYEKLKHNLISIASELFRFQRVFAKAVSKLEVDEQNKYHSQYAWFSKKVLKALNDSGFKVISVDGQLYDPGIAVTPLNLDDFEADDILYVEQTLEPIIMEGETVIKTGTVLLGRKVQ
jgi:molecular chaperone GrpE (heat shock protein)